MPSSESDALRAHYQTMADRLAANPAMDLETLRSMVEELHARAAEPPGVAYEEQSIKAIPALWCRPEGAATDRVLVYFHGGGFVVNTMHSHRKLAAHLARATGCQALVPDYRLAPEHPFPAQIEDAIVLYDHLLASGFESDRIALAGDSAGGNLAISLALRLRDRGDPPPAAIVGISPWLDIECGTGTLDSNAATDVFIQRPVVENMATMFLGDASPEDPGANPLRAEISGLPPTFLTAGGHESLRDNAERFAELARTAGVSAELHIEPGMQHVYPFMAGRAPEADATITNIAAWLRPLLGPA